VRLPDVDLARFELLRKSHETKIPFISILYFIKQRSPATVPVNALTGLQSR
jgi:hypothetical protein